MIAAADGVSCCGPWRDAAHHGIGITSTAISNLLLATGNYMRPGPVLIRCADITMCRARAIMGMRILPRLSEGGRPAIRAKFEKAWNVTLPPKPGLDNHLMIDAIQDGRLKSMYVFGEEMSMVHSNANYVGDALSKLDFFVVQEIFFTETCRFADGDFCRAPRAWRRKGRSRVRSGAFKGSIGRWSR